MHPTLPFNARIRQPLQQLAAISIILAVVIVKTWYINTYSNEDPAKTTLQKSAAKVMTSQEQEWDPSHFPGNSSHLKKQPALMN
jgi:hypothetical protein